MQPSLGSAFPVFWLPSPPAPRRSSLCYGICQEISWQHLHLYGWKGVNSLSLSLSLSSLAWLGLSTWKHTPIDCSLTLTSTNFSGCWPGLGSVLRRDVCPCLCCVVLHNDQHSLLGSARGCPGSAASALCGWKGVNSLSLFLSLWKPRLRRLATLLDPYTSGGSAHVGEQSTN